MRMRESEPLHMTRNATWKSHCEKQYGHPSKVKSYYLAQQFYIKAYLWKKIESGLSQRYAYVSVCRSNITTHNLWKLFKHLARSGKTSVLKKGRKF